MKTKKKKNILKDILLRNLLHSPEEGGPQVRTAAGARVGREAKLSNSNFSLVAKVHHIICNHKFLINIEKPEIVKYAHCARNRVKETAYLLGIYNGPIIP